MLPRTPTDLPTAAPAGRKFVSGSDAGTELLRAVTQSVLAGSAVGAAFDGMPGGHPHLTAYEPRAYPLRQRSDGLCAGQVGAGGMLALLTLRGSLISLLDGEAAPCAHAIREQVRGWAHSESAARRGYEYGRAPVEQLLPAALLLGAFQAVRPATDPAALIEQLVVPRPHVESLHAFGAMLAEWARLALTEGTYFVTEKGIDDRTKIAAGVYRSYGPLAARTEISDDPVAAVIDQAGVGLHLARDLGDPYVGLRAVLTMGGPTDAAASVYLGILTCMQLARPGRFPWRAPDQGWEWRTLDYRDRRDAERTLSRTRACLDAPRNLGCLN